MQRRAMIALAMTTILWTATGHAQTLTGTLKKVADSGTLTIGYRENALPFSYTGSDGKPAGYSIDLCQEIAVAVQQELKLPNMAVRWVPVTPENRVDAVANGTVDIECGSTTASLSRQEKVDFTLMTFVDGASLLIAEGSGLKTVADLAGKRIGVAPGTTTEKAVSDFLRSQSISATIVPVKDHDEGLAALQTSKIEAYASDRTILVGLVLQARGTSRYALISAGYGNRFHHPRPEAVARWRDAGARVLVTMDTGAQRVWLGSSGIAVATRRAQQPRLWDAARRDPGTP